MMRPRVRIALSPALSPLRATVLAAPLCASTLLASLLAAGCTTALHPTRVVVATTPPGDRAYHEDGASLAMKRWDLEGRRGLTKGYYVVKSELEWRQLWPSLEADRIPLLPPGIDFDHEMLLVAAPTEKHAVGAAVSQVIDTEQNGVHVYVAETMPGVGCGASDDAPPAYALVRVPRVDDKEVRFHVDTVHGRACGAPPNVQIACRPERTTQPLEATLRVKPATAVACLAEVETSRAVLDRTWTFTSLPSGTFAKMTVGEAGTGVSFVPDAFGTYTMQLQVIDDLQRIAASTTQIEVAPPKDALVLQMTWSKYDPNDDPTTFPRIELHVQPVITPVKGPLPAAKGAQAKLGIEPVATAPRWGNPKTECTVESDSPPAWCSASVAGPTTIETLDRGAAKRYAVAVRYVDERVDGQPVVCVRAYRDGKARTELCDPTPRKEGAWWEAGIIDTESGLTPEALAQAQAEAAAKAAAERMAKERAEKERLDKERLQTEQRAEKERLEKERGAATAPAPPPAPATAKPATRAAPNGAAGAK